MLIDSGLPAEMWPFAIKTTAYISNQMNRQDETKPPISQWREYFNLPNADVTLKHIKIFGCRAYVHIPKEDRVKSQKIDPRADIGYLVGYKEENSHIYKIWIPSKNKVIRTRDVTFYEEKTYQDNQQGGLPTAPGTGPKAGLLSGDTPGAAMKLPPIQITRAPASKPKKAVFQETKQAEPPAPAPERIESPIRDRVQTISDSPEAARDIRQIRDAPEVPEINMTDVPNATTYIQRPQIHQSPFADAREHTKRVPEPNDIGMADVPIKSIEYPQDTDDIEPANQRFYNALTHINHSPGTPTPAPRFQTLSKPAPNQPIRAQEIQRQSDLTTQNKQHASTQIGQQASARIERHISQRTNKGIAAPWYGNEQADKSWGLAAASTERIKAYKVKIPSNFKQAMASAQKDDWWATIDDQIRQLTAMNTYKLVPRPQKGNILPEKWVYNLKIDSDGYINQFRARWVICGNRQKPGINFNDTYAPVAAETSIKMALTAIACKSLE